MATIFMVNDYINVSETYEQIKELVTFHDWIEVTEKTYRGDEKYREEKNIIQVSKIVRFKD
jgi:hypothetical protein